MHYTINQDQKNAFICHERVRASAFCLEDSCKYLLIFIIGSRQCGFSLLYVVHASSVETPDERSLLFYYNEFLQSYNSASYSCVSCARVPNDPHPPLPPKRSR